jgi:CRISPR-associated Csx3 family protein
MAFHALHGSAAAVVCTYDPRLGAVVTASHVKDIKEGTIFDLSPPE